MFSYLPDLDIVSEYLKKNLFLYIHVSMLDRSVLNMSSLTSTWKGLIQANIEKRRYFFSLVFWKHRSSWYESVISAGCDANLLCVFKRSNNYIYQTSRGYVITTLSKQILVKYKLYYYTNQYIFKAKIGIVVSPFNLLHLWAIVLLAMQCRRAEGIRQGNVGKT